MICNKLFFLRIIKYKQKLQKIYIKFYKKLLFILNFLNFLLEFVYN